ncbi:S-adenosyl-L-methionine-dependent methyltransferase [Cercophora newfieldiana]|uniref:S-adenosyl-L-methionine-dependent methyltransferase n=1 Tax=Cercophora newfieldiana TaxID=92897 RepID=A0AA39XSL0_9PEZI|nr:S-adenosyl-L-methionine-dependent methyltransferase [Cercophora newfieldiana]
MATIDDVARAELKTTADELQTAVDAFLAGQEKGDVDTCRKTIIDACEKMLQTVKPPGHFQWMERVRQMGVMGVTHLFQEWGAFDHIPEQGAISFAELGKKLDAETSLTERLSGVLIVAGILRLVGTDSVAHTPSSLIFLRGNPSGVVYRVAWDNCLVAYFHMADFFAKYGRKEPQGLTHIPASFARGHPDKPFFEVLAMDPPYLKRFTDAMAIIEAMSPAVTAGMHDFSWLVQKAEQEPNRPVFVDVGGGKGQCILTIHQEFPGIPLNRCVLQERPEVIQAVEAAADPTLAEVQKVVIDFHVAQPTKGSDTIAANILRIIAEAMADDSKLLIQEDVKDFHGPRPDTDTAVLDFLMLTYGGKERTRRCWEDITERAGLSIVSVSGGDGPWHGLFVIECVKKT